jgi:hypothetical protein
MVYTLCLLRSKIGNGTDKFLTLRNSRAVTTLELVCLLLIANCLLILDFYQLNDSPAAHP